MKKILLATSILAASAGVAMAEVSFSGNTRLGMTNALDTDGTEYQDFEFYLRVRGTASFSGETDSGLTFGASVDFHNFQAAGAGNSCATVPDNTNLPPDADTDPDQVCTSNGQDNNGSATAYISGEFGKITFGDVGDAGDNLIGNVDEVGTGVLPANNELGYIGNDKTAVKYEGTFGNLSVTAGVGQLDSNNDGVDDQDYSVAVKYSFGDFGVYAGYSDNGDGDDETTIGADATFGNFTVKARAQDCSCDGDMTWAVSGTGKFDAISVTAYYADHDAYTSAGIGGAYDLGGGAKMMAGATQSSGAGATTEETLIDIGMKFSF